MIVRMWRGQAKAENADAYEHSSPPRCSPNCRRSQATAAPIS